MGATTWFGMSGSPRTARPGLCTALQSDGGAASCRLTRLKSSRNTPASCSWILATRRAWAGRQRITTRQLSRVPAHEFQLSDRHLVNGLKLDLIDFGVIR